MISLITSSTTDPRPIAQTHDWRLCLRRFRQSYALIDRLINTRCMWFQPMLGRLLLLRYNKLVGNLGVRHCLCTAYKTTTYNGKMRTPSARDLVTYPVNLLTRSPD